jgi:glycerol-3-phosphate O-acyltransferase
VKVRDGVLESEQIRRAIDNGLRKKGVSAEADRKRALTRKRS